MHLVSATESVQAEVSAEAHKYSGAKCLSSSLSDIVLSIILLTSSQLVGILTFMFRYASQEPQTAREKTEQNNLAQNTVVLFPVLKWF